MYGLMSLITKTASVDTNNVQSSQNIQTLTKYDKLGMVIYPYISTKYGLCIDSDDPRSYIVFKSW